MVSIDLLHVLELNNSALRLRPDISASLTFLPFGQSYMAAEAIRDDRLPFVRIRKSAYVGSKPLWSFPS
jgi:hypothetical protein